MFAKVLTRLSRHNSPALGRWRVKTQTEALRAPIADPGYSAPLESTPFPVKHGQPRNKYATIGLITTLLVTGGAALRFEIV